jgi:hypothetical protein
MVADLPQNLVWLFAAVHIIGLLSAPLARLAEHRSGEMTLQWLFVAAMAAIAAATLICLAFGCAAWVLSGATLSVMLVTAVWDPGIQAGS